MGRRRGKTVAGGKGFPFSLSLSCSILIFFKNRRYARQLFSRVFSLTLRRFKSVYAGRRRRKTVVYAGNVVRKCARCHENGTALNIKKKHKWYPGGFLCNECKVYEAFDDPRGCGVCCNHLYGYKLTLPEMEKILEHDGALKQLGELTFPPNASPLDRDVCGVCWVMLRTRLGDMAKRERKAAYKEMILKSGNTHEERVEFAKQRLELHIEKIKESLDAFRAAVRARDQAER